MRILAEGLNLW